jgi:hypothetical protein
MGSVSCTLLPSAGHGSQKGSLFLEEAKEESQKGVAADTWTALSFIGAWMEDHRDNRCALLLTAQFDVCFHAIPKSAQISPNQTMTQSRQNQMKPDETRQNQILDSRSRQNQIFFKSGTPCRPRGAGWLPKEGAG